MLTVLSSWATPCGVASTTSALMDNLTTLGVDWQVIAPNRQPFIPPEKPYKAIFYTNEQALSEDTTERRARIEELKATASELKVAEKFKSLYYD